MKRIHMSDKINRNNSAEVNNTYRKTSRINTLTPEVLVSQIWLHDDDTTAVEIIELNSSDDSEPSSVAAPQYKFSNAWSYINDNRFQDVEDDYRVNKKARERRRLKNNNRKRFTTNLSVNRNIYNENAATRNHVYTDFTTNDDISNKSMTLNHQMNCFTIIDKHFVASDNSSDYRDDAETEIISTDMSPQQNNWDSDKQYNEEIRTYEPDVETEKRTIWIYSFKNKRLLSENDFELVNIPSKDTSSSATSYSPDDEEQTKDKTTDVCRLGSPIPATYIPRLNLSLAQTLSTVTEITESNKQPSSNETEASLVNDNITRKPINSWIVNPETEKSLNKSDESSNVINWMALSPRERRRKFKNMNSVTLYKGQTTLPETQTSSFAEEKQNVSSESNKLAAKQVQVDVDIHVSGETREIKSITTPKGTNEINKKVNIKPVEIIYADTFNEPSDSEDRGDYDRRKKLRKPQIRLNTKTSAQNITDPIEKLDSNNWIAVKSNVIETRTYDYELGTAVEISSRDDVMNDASKNLWKRNISLMKPAEWSEYVPITESPRHLHLSLSSISGQKSWFIRLIRCLKCFK